MPNAKAKRVVIDTNIFISALLGAETSRDIVELWLKKTFELFTSNELLEEILKTLEKPKISKRVSGREANLLIATIKTQAKFIKPVQTINICRDPKDNMLLEVTLSAETAILVSGDSDLLVIRSFKGADIISPADFLKRLKTESL